MLDSPITTNDVNTFAVEAITSVNKDEIVKQSLQQGVQLLFYRGVSGNYSESTLARMR